MVEFNLLPDVKAKYLHTKRLERLIITVSFIVGAASLAVFILLFLFVDVAQKVRINNLDNTISTSEHQLQTGSNLNKILTIQKQLQTLPTIENESPQVSRVFGYLGSLTPTNATISTLTLNLQANTVEIEGAADSLNTVNQFVDTLKFATYKNGKASGNQAFSEVTLTAFGYNDIGGQQTTSSYTIGFNYNPALFNPSDKITLVVPTETTTRSVLDSPSVLFKSNNGSN